MYRFNTRVVYNNDRREKESDLTQTYDKSPYTQKSKKQRDNIKTSPITSITQRFQTDFGRSVWSNNSHPTGVVKPVYDVLIANVASAWI